MLSNAVPSYFSSDSLIPTIKKTYSLGTVENITGAGEFIFNFTLTNITYIILWFYPQNNTLYTLALYENASFDSPISWVSSEYSEDVLFITYYGGPGNYSAVLTIEGWGWGYFCVEYAQNITSSVMFEETDFVNMYLMNASKEYFYNITLVPYNCDIDLIVVSFDEVNASGILFAYSCLRNINSTESLKINVSKNTTLGIITLRVHGYGNATMFVIKSLYSPIENMVSLFTFFAVLFFITLSCVVITILIQRYEEKV